MRNHYRTRRYSWDEVEGFRVGTPTMGMPVGKVVHALLADGSIIALDVTMRPWLLSKSKAKLDRHLEALRAWVPST